MKLVGGKWVLYLFLFGVLLSLGRAYAGDVYWDGEGGDKKWSNPANWSGDRLPGQGDKVKFVGVEGDVYDDVDQDVVFDWVEVLGSGVYLFTNGFQANNVRIGSQGLGVIIQDSGEVRVSDTLYISGAGGVASHYESRGGSLSAGTIRMLDWAEMYLRRGSVDADRFYTDQYTYLLLEGGRLNTGMLVSGFSSGEIKILDGTLEVGYGQVAANVTIEGGRFYVDELRLVNGSEYLQTGGSVGVRRKATIGYVGGVFFDMRGGYFGVSEGALEVTPSSIVYIRGGGMSGGELRIAGCPRVSVESGSLQFKRINIYRNLSSDPIITHTGGEVRAHEGLDMSSGKYWFKGGYFKVLGNSDAKARIGRDARFYHLGGEAFFTILDVEGTYLAEPQYGNFFLAGDEVNVYGEFYLKDAQISVGDWNVRAGGKVWASGEMKGRLQVLGGEFSPGSGPGKVGRLLTRDRIYHDDDLVTAMEGGQRARLVFDLASPDYYDQLTVESLYLSDVDVVLNLLDGFVPEIGDVFRLIYAWESVEVDPNTVRFLFPDLGPEKRWVAEWDDHYLKAEVTSVVPEPSTVGLFLLGLVGVLIRSRQPKGRF